MIHKSYGQRYQRFNKYTFLNQFSAQQISLFVNTFKMLGLSLNNVLLFVTMKLSHILKKAQQTMKQAFK